MAGEFFQGISEGIKPATALALKAAELKRQEDALNLKARLESQEHQIKVGTLLNSIQQHQQTQTLKALDHAEGVAINSGNQALFDQVTRKKNEIFGFGDMGMNPVQNEQYVPPGAPVFPMPMSKFEHDKALKILEQQGREPKLYATEEGYLPAEQAMGKGQPQRGMSLEERETLERLRASLRQPTEPKGEFETFKAGIPKLEGEADPVWNRRVADEWNNRQQGRTVFRIEAGAAQKEKEQKKYDVKAQKIGDAIIDGTQPPELSGFGMSKIAPQVREYLADKGFDLTAASSDWIGTKKHLQSLNSTQQLRLGQAITFTRDSLEIIRDLARKWQGGQFPILNKANLALARNGVYGNEAASIATRLHSQIADLTSELGTVYKGGNSSTDESLKLAAENLKGEWDMGVLEDNVDQIEKNLDIRLRSMKASGASGLSPGSKYERKPTVEPELEKKTTEYKVGDLYKGKKIKGINRATKQLNVEGIGVVSY